VSREAAEILLVEDNPNDLELALHAFKKTGLAARIRVARDGAEALDYLFKRDPQPGAEPEEYPRLVLLDLKLPKIDGIEVLRQIKADPRLRKLPVVVMTSSRQDRDIDECYSLGVNSYIVKPVDFEKFTAAATILGQYWLSYNQPPTIA
jgi:two-component system response regulator